MIEQAFRGKKEMVMDICKGVPSRQRSWKWKLKLQVGANSSLLDLQSLRIEASWRKQNFPACWWDQMCKHGDHIGIIFSGAGV
jgi:hypothetical protein